MSNIDKQAGTGNEITKTYYIHPAAFGSTKNPGYGHVPVVKADEAEKLRAKLEAAEKRIAELEARDIRPAKGEVLVTVTGFTGCGKSAIAGEIEIAMKAIGVPVQWANGDAEKRMTGADWLTAIEMYKPNVRIVEVNVPHSAAAGKGEAS